MPLSDRALYRAVYSAVGEVAKGKGKGGGKGKKVPLTVFAKATLLNVAFADQPAPPDLVSIVTPPGGSGKGKKAKPRAGDAALVQIARTTTALLKGTVSGSQPPAKVMNTLASLKDNDLLALIDKATGAAKPSSNGKAQFTQAFLAPSFGYLHLERLRFTPEGVDRGELLYSLALAPGEEVTLVHKSWSKTKREFTEIIANEAERSATTQRTESNELAESTQSQFQFGSEMSSSFQGSGTIGVVELGGSASTSFNASYQQSQEHSIKRSLQLTEQATARAKQEHKITFQVTSEVGVEDESRRLIRNPNRTHAVQYDYYRCMRKWRIDLERYGVRLMMDLMVPNPGVRLRQEFQRRKDLEDAANGTFSCGLTAADIDPNNLPPGVPQQPANLTLTASGESDPTISDSSEKTHSFDVPAGYEVASEPTVTKTGGGGWCELRGGPYTGATGTVGVQVHRGVAAGEDRVSYRITLKVRPTAATLSAWQSSAIQAMCAAKQQEFEARRAAAQLELDTLTTRAADTPTIVLRKDERLEVMRGVSSQLLRPSGLNLPEAPADVVRFVHEALEWENMTYFLYPYFWRNIPHALEIEHPDMLRRDFLRAGWARVLVPVRPGYEHRMMAYSYSGSVDGTAPAEMRSVAQQVQDEAKARFDFVQTPEGDDAGDYEVIATWHEYTPTDGVYMSAAAGAQDVAEPSLTAEFRDAEARRAAENAGLAATAAFRQEIANRAATLPAKTEFAVLRDEQGDRIILTKDETA